jgi:SAM-dependent methyltransferase
MAERPRRETQAFFSARAATWDARFPFDLPAYARAVDELAPPQGAAVLDLGTGTGRAIPSLRRRVGPTGFVVAIDVTWEMLMATRRAGRDNDARLAMADGCDLPFAPRCFDAIFAGAIIHHLPGPHHGLDELGRVSRPGTRLAIFHPIGRAALAARRGRSVSSDDFLAADNLEWCLRGNGWTMFGIDDSDDRYLALARRD